MANNVFSTLIDREPLEFELVNSKGETYIRKVAGRGFQTVALRAAVANMAKATIGQENEGDVSGAAVMQAVQKLDPTFSAWSPDRVERYARGVITGEKKAQEDPEAEQPQWLVYDDGLQKAAHRIAAIARKLSAS